MVSRGKISSWLLQHTSISKGMVAGGSRGIGFSGCCVITNDTVLIVVIITYNYSLTLVTTAATYFLSGVWGVGVGWVCPARRPRPSPEHTPAQFSIIALYSYRVIFSESLLC